MSFGQIRTRRTEFCIVVIPQPRGDSFLAASVAFLRQRNVVGIHVETDSRVTKAVLITGIVGGALALLLVSLRLLARRPGAGGGEFGLDDWTIIRTMVR